MANTKVLPQRKKVLSPFTVEQQVKDAMKEMSIKDGVSASGIVNQLLKSYLETKGYNFD